MKKKILLFLMLAMMSLGSVYAQSSSTQLIPKYELVTTANNDTLIKLCLNKDQAESTLRYINNLKTTEKLYYVSLEENVLLNQNIEILNKRIENYTEQIKVKDDALTFITETNQLISEENKNLVKSSYKSGLNKGIVVGSIITVLLCLLIN